MRHKREPTMNKAGRSPPTTVPERARDAGKPSNRVPHVRIVRDFLRELNQRKHFISIPTVDSDKKEKRQPRIARRKLPAQIDSCNCPNVRLTSFTSNRNPLKTIGGRTKIEIQPSDFQTFYHVKISSMFYNLYYVHHQDVVSGWVCRISCNALILSSLHLQTGHYFPNYLL